MFSAALDQETDIEIFKEERAMKYRKKPVVVEAVQWTGLNLEEIKKFVGGALTYIINDTAWEVGKGKPHVYMKIRTLEGDMEVSKKDFIIKGVNGEFYPCKPDIFQKTYDPENDQQTVHNSDQSAKTDGRLIKADSLKDRASKYSLNEDEYRRFCKIIDAEPTAYDLDKVVEQLRDEEELSYADFEIYAEEHELSEDDDWHHRGLGRAVEIVKRGGVC